MEAASETQRSQIAIDIGSTVVKVARIDEVGRLVSQQFFPRDFEAGIARQVNGLLEALGIDAAQDPIVACSSANGGLRVGIVSISSRFSGATLRNQVLLAGANPVFVHDLERPAGDPQRVDILLVGGGIDCEDADPVARRLRAFDATRYRFGSLVYAGNRFLAAEFARRHPGVTVVPNPLGETMTSCVGSVFEAVRRAYLDDLVLKEGLAELPRTLARTVRPTPEVASRGFLRSVLNQSTFTIIGGCLVLDIGGATTDLHYTVDIVDDASPERPAGGVSVARYVFTDLGIVASRDTLIMQLRAHPKLHEFLGVVPSVDQRDVYARLRDGEYDPSPHLLSYACVFLALDRFAQGRGPGLPVARLNRVSQVILTGGAAQTLDEVAVQRVVQMLAPAGSAVPLVQIDRRYEIWVAGITWTEDAPS